MKKVIEQILRKVLGEVLGAESLAGILKAVVEKVLTENREWVVEIAGKVREIAEAEKGKATDETPAPTVEGETRQDAASPDVAAGDPAGAPTLDWCYGGFQGGKAKVAENAVLESATLKGDTLTLKWAKGGCEQLGASSAEDHEHTVACLFLADGKGGKFEWISTSRLTRGMANIKTKGYKGWPKSALDGGGTLWFCIAGVKDDKATSNGKRTALIEVKRA